jgi:hypothetical protein
VASKIDIVDSTKRYKAELHGFFMDTKSWHGFKTRYTLRWNKVRFGGGDPIPRQPGIYAFTVEVSPSKLPTHGYILYIGITGDGDSKATLKSRYQQYVREQADDDGRPRVRFMLNNWDGDLWFNFATFRTRSVDLGRLERDMLNAVQPPVNQSDFTAEFAVPRRAAF